ncbi:MAG: gamma-glutamyltransferase, partial [Cyanobacteria bacterium P01_A01_bin.116]
FKMPIAEAVMTTRIHWEKGVFHVEPGFKSMSAKNFESALFGTEQVVQWQQSNMFFGGVHAVGLDGEGALQGTGDARRSGAVAYAK